LNKKFTIIIFAESNVGLIVRITTMFLRRRIHIESLHVTICGPEGIYRFSLVICETDETARKIMLQVDKQVEVFKSFYNTNADALLDEEQSFLRKSSSEPELQNSQQLLVTI
jgi:acetolactate synthase I/III small subunit